MEENKKNKKASYPQKIWDNSMSFIEGVGVSLKFKKDDTMLIKFLKILLRIIGVLVLIAVSPLLIVTIFLIIAFAM